MRRFGPKPAAFCAATLCACGAAAFLTLRGEAAPPAADRPLVIYGEDGLTPVFVEDPIHEESGLPIPIGPQHQATAVRVPGRAIPTQPPARLVSLEEAAAELWAGGWDEVNRRKAAGLPLLPPHIRAQYDRMVAEEAARLAAEKPSYEEEFKAEAGGE